MKLFLDDYRQPKDCVKYMSPKLGPKALIYLEDGWIVAKNYEEFKFVIRVHGLPDFISFDHDLADAHYTGGTLVNYSCMVEKSGYHCAVWLVGQCIDNDLPIPDFAVHSMNPVGAENIQSLLHQFKVYQNEESSRRPNVG